MSGGTPYGESTIAGPRGSDSRRRTSWLSPGPRADTWPRSRRSWPAG